MDTEHYVNLPADERSNREEQRENRHSGGLKIFKFVGISFGLLCVIQAALNVSLRLQAAVMQTQHKDFHLNVKANDIFRLEVTQLSEELCQMMKHLLQYPLNSGQSDWSNMSSINFTMTSADDIRDLILERNQLLQDKDQLVKEKKRLQFQNGRLTDDKKTLNDKVAEQQIQIQELETKVQTPPSCPQGWLRYMSSCYLVSSETDTWENARHDCVRHGAHLVIFDYEAEERVAHIFGGIMWMGLRNRFDVLTRSWTWTWVDGSQPVYTNWNDPPPRGNDCAYVDATSPRTNAWLQGACEGELYWMCEKDLHKNSIGPG